MEPGQFVVGWVVLGTTLPLAAMCWLTYRHSHTPGSRGLRITLAGFLCWNVVSGLLILRPTTTTFSALWGVHLFAANLAAIGWAVMVLEYTRRRRLEIGYRGWGLLFAIPICTQLLYATNTWHHLVVQPTSSVTAAGVLEIDHGGWFYVHAIYNYGVLVAGTAILLVGDLVRSAGIHRRQTFVLLAGMVIAIGASVGFLVPLPLPSYVDPAPFGFLLTGSIWTYAVFRHQLFNLVPVARRTAVETIPDAMIAIDVNGVVVDLNGAAMDLFDATKADIGSEARVFFGQYPSLLERFSREREFDAEISVVDDGVVRHFSVTVTPVDYGGPGVGTIVILRDVTSLKSRQQELALLQRLFSRVLRHNLRTDLQYIRGYAEEIADEADREDVVSHAETIVERADELERTSQKARRIEGVIGTEDEHTVFDLESLLERCVDDLESSYPGVDVRLANVESIWVRAHPELGSAVENLLENAAVHAEVAAPRVDVSVATAGSDHDAAVGRDGVLAGRDGTSADRDGADADGDDAGATREAIELTVADDGPGIPLDELEALRSRREAPLEHGSGAGLWLTDWVIEKSGGDLSFEVTDDGTVATVTLPVATDVPE
ncbi:histidine kinase N-terminal 7TM domain-containing protein [Natrarchaeobaculum aegyptiacum]|uniref:histidine kinase n=1 Tax=Natrarchaeobaculum aegyptiacum TaxID=745377 RepID=A0A2Z2HQP2_9EURY|nr:histidine kinase N-terminal 7TM domain-containing protein [Natrarchaeobaculum aegyptiacum]ARS89470.1 hypothetical protein B1756_06735 [Natrarchaeobaculum aegyptiacum]